MRRWPICMLVEKYQKTCICDKRDKLQRFLTRLVSVFSIFGLWIGLFYNDVMSSRCYYKVTIHISIYTYTHACMHLSQETSEKDPITLGTSARYLRMMLENTTVYFSHRSKKLRFEPMCTVTNCNATNQNTFVILSLIVIKTKCAKWTSSDKCPVILKLCSVYLRETSRTFLT